MLPTKSYGMKLLEFSYKKPIYAIALFAISIITGIALVHYTVHIDVPILGAANIQVPTSLTGGISVSALVSSNFVWPFYMGITTAVLCVIARLYHPKLMKRANIQTTAALPAK
jgi:hypothetical protein